MNLLITAGNTLAPIDRVRGLTNVFTGRTGADVALHAHARGHRVVLLTSRPDAVSALNPDAADLGERWTLSRYSTYDDLHSLMERRVRAGDVDALIHSAAVSDYLAAGVYAPAEGTFDTGAQTDRPRPRRLELPRPPGQVQAGSRIG